MPIILTPEEIAALRFDLDEALDVYVTALRRHARTRRGQAAPSAHPLVEQIVRAGGYAIQEAPE